MAAATRSKPAGRVPPPPRGRPYLDARSGRMMILPKSGGKAVPHVASAEPFSAKTALRRAGVRTARRTVAAGDRAAAAAPRTTWDALGRAGALPNLGGSSTGVGGLLIYALGTIIGLALLENVLSGRGPAAVETVLGGFGGALSKLVNPNDPLVARGTVPAPQATTSPAAASAPATGATTKPAGSYKASPVSVDRVRFTGQPLTGTDKGFVASVAAAAAAAGATIVDVISGYRSPEHNKAVGGVPNSNHTTGHALDGRAFIPGYGWVPLGDLPTLSKFGVRSGDQPGFYQGGRDPNHVDDASNQK